MTSSPASDERAGGTIGWLIGGLVVLVGIAAVLSRRERLPDVLGTEPEVLEPVAHGILAAFLALIVAVVVERKPRLFGRLARRPALTGFAFAMVSTNLLELGQATVPARAVSFEDLAANTIGAAVGGLLALMVGRLPGAVTTRVVAAVMLIGIAGGTWAAVVEVPLGTSCDADVVSEPGPQPVPELPSDQILMAYDLSQPVDGPVLAVPELGGGPALSAVGEGTIATSPTGLIFDDREADAFLSSPAAGRLVGTAVRNQGTVMVELATTPTRLTRGPARIVALSIGVTPSSVNFHIGQHERELSVRLRLGCGQFNWTRIDDVFAEGQRRHIVVSFADATQRVWVDGELIDERTFTDDFATTVNWSPAMPLLVGNEPQGGRQYYGEVEFVRIGLADPQPSG